MMSTQNLSNWDFKIVRSLLPRILYNDNNSTLSNKPDSKIYLSNIKIYLCSAKDVSLAFFVSQLFENW